MERESLRYFNIWHSWNDRSSDSTTTTAAAATTTSSDYYIAANISLPNRQLQNELQIMANIDLIINIIFLSCVVQVQAIILKLHDFFVFFFFTQSFFSDDYRLLWIIYDRSLLFFDLLILP